MLQAVTIYNLSQQLDPKEFGKLMTLFDRDERKDGRAPKQETTKFPTVEEVIERLLAGPMRSRSTNWQIHKNNDTPSK